MEFAARVCFKRLGIAGVVGGGGAFYDLRFFVADSDALGSAAAGECQFAVYGVTGVASCVGAFVVGGTWGRDRDIAFIAALVDGASCCPEAAGQSAGVRFVFAVGGIAVDVAFVQRPEQGAVLVLVADNASCIAFAFGCGHGDFSLVGDIDDGTVVGISDDAAGAGDVICRGYFSSGDFPVIAAFFYGGGSCGRAWHTAYNAAGINVLLEGSLVFDFHVIDASCNGAAFC